MSKTTSTKFDWPIIGHQNVVNYLQQSLVKNNLTHAYLFHGPQHLGKKTVAHYFIKSLFCQGESKQPCDHCSTCQQISKGLHPDFYKLNREEGKKNISIEQIRELRRQLQNSSLLNYYKVALIDEAETMSQAAANALLKTLEEPTPRTIIILLARRREALPETIVSRAQAIRFENVQIAEIAKALAQRGELNAKEIAHVALGRPGRALRYQEQPEDFEAYKERSQELLAIINMPLYKRWQALQGLMPAKNTAVEAREESLSVIRHLESLWRDLYLINSGQAEAVQHVFLLPELERLAINYSAKQFLISFRYFQESFKALYHNAQPLLALETTVLML